MPLTSKRRATREGQLGNFNEPTESEADMFNPETVHALGEALDEAWRRAKVATHLNGKADGARTLIAKHMIALARQGERDRQRLIEGALARLSL